MEANEETLKDLKLLFEFVPPDKLRSNLNYLLFQFLTQNPEAASESSKELFENLYFLHEFLEKSASRGK
jgi:hypothetical protein